MAERSERSSLGGMVQCSVCLELMTEPKALKCLHHFCSNCVNTLIKYNSKETPGINCPKCREFTAEHEIRKSFIMSEVLEYYLCSKKQKTGDRNSNGDRSSTPHRNSDGDRFR